MLWDFKHDCIKRPDKGKKITHAAQKTKYTEKH